MDAIREQLQAALGDAFRLERELGGGGMSRVFIAEELAFGRRVVVKLLHPEIAEGASEERFKREIQLAARLQHPHIVPLFGGGEARASERGPRLLYYTMPFVEGESLRARLDREPRLPVAEALQLAREVAEALAYAHAHGVVHRDVKPENVLLSGGHALVADFGIARALGQVGDSRLTGTGIALGTPAYMSPEQAVGDAEIDSRSDVYSLGCVLYEMLAGEPPFAGPTVQALVARRFVERPPSVRERSELVSDEVDAITAKAMATLPAERFATASDLAIALDAARSGGSPRTARRRALRGWSASRRATSVGAVAAVLMALVAAGTWAMRDRQSAAAPATGTSPQAAALPAVAVLYLRSWSGDTLDGYLTEGLTEEITSRLGRVEGLRVKSRGAVARARGDSSLDDPTAAGRLLDVQYVVEGSVRRADRRVRVAIRLVRTDDGSQVWSEEYDATMGDLIALQDSIAGQVATRIGGRLSARSVSLVRREPASYDSEAYDRFLRGNYLLARRTPRTVGQAIEEFDAAARIDATLVAALARQAYAFAVYADWGWAHPRFDREEMVRRGLATAERALARDSSSADAWMARALLLLLRHPRTMDDVLPTFERALALDSANAEANYQFGQALMAAGHTAAAIGRYRRAIALEPEWASPLMSLGALISRSGNWDDALPWLDSAVAVDPSSSYSYTVRAMVRAAAGDTAGTRGDAERALRLATGYRVPALAARAIAAATAGDRAAAARWADSAAHAIPDPAHLSANDAFYVSLAFVQAGDRARALQLLERGPANAWLWFYTRHPLLNVLRDDPGFVRLRARWEPPGV